MENLFEQWITARDKHAEESDMECRYDAFLEIKLLEAKAEIDVYKKAMVHVAAELAKELHSEECTEAQDRRLYKLICELRDSALAKHKGSK